VRRLVAFYVTEHNETIPHSAFDRQTPDEVYFGRGAQVPDELAARRHAARQQRVVSNPFHSLLAVSTRRTCIRRRYGRMTFGTSWTHLHHGSSRTPQLGGTSKHLGAAEGAALISWARSVAIKYP
jgi:hypothetical protein